jgi:hydrogenase-4 component B
LLELGVIHGVLAVLALACAASLRLKAGANGLRLGPTWDCGYAAPTARMQYTSGSFAGIAASWFSWILRTERRVRRPRGPLPANASWVERVPETVLERVITPAGGAILLASSAARRLQHGRLQAYVLYLMAGLAVLGALVALGSLP